MANLPTFNRTLFQQELEDSYQVVINPLGDITQGPIEFNIIGNDDFIDLSATTLHVKVKLAKADGVAHAKDAEVALINNAMHSLFSDVIVTINDTIVEGGEQQYYLKAFLSTLFTYSDTTMDKQLFASGFAKDEGGTAYDKAGKGYLARRA